MLEMSTFEGSAELMLQWLRAGYQQNLNWRLVALNRPQRDRASSQQYLAVPGLCKPNPTHFPKVFDKDYSGGGGKKGGFVMVHLSSLNFLRSYSIFILIEKSSSTDSGAGKIRDGCLHGWQMDKLLLGLTHAKLFLRANDQNGRFLVCLVPTDSASRSVSWDEALSKQPPKASAVGLNHPSPPQKPLLCTSGH